MQERGMDGVPSRNAGSATLIGAKLHRYAHLMFVRLRSKNQGSVRKNTGAAPSYPRGEGGMQLF